MTFLFVDRILELEPRQHCLGVMHVTADNPYLLKNGAELPILMPSIVGEALGQLGAWNVLYSNDFKMRPVAGIVNEVKLYGNVHLGDSVCLETWIDDLDDSRVAYHSMATVRGNPVFEIVSALGPLLPLSDFNDPEEVKQQFTMINRPGKWEDKVKHNGSQAVLNYPYHAVPVAFDKIIKWDSQQEVVAQKSISLRAGYFTDHFPRKPVLPLTLLLHCKLQLAEKFLEELLAGTKSQIKLSGLRNVKMKGFVQPGDTVETALRVREHTADHVVLGFVSKVEDKRVCFAEAAYH